MSKRIVLTGGGTAGHVTPNLALLPKLKEAGYEVFYIGSKAGIEKKLIEDYKIPYYGISTGKLRRYFDLKNFSDPFRIIKGFSEAKAILKELKPDIVFSKGGFVSVPVVRAAHARKIPSIIHESDITPGLANKLCIPVAKKICCNFPETMNYVSKKKGVLTGTPIREELKTGSKEAGLAFTGFTDKLPVLLIIGGSQGSRSVNNMVRQSLPKLLESFQVIHLCGKGNLDDKLSGIDGYVQYEYIKDELKDLFAASDVIVSRAGANAICEILALRKPNLLIPLPTGRGDQILNAKSFKAQGFSQLLLEEDMTEESFLENVHSLYKNKNEYVNAMMASKQTDPIETIFSLIETYKK